MRRILSASLFALLATLAGAQSAAPKPADKPAESAIVAPRSGATLLPAATPIELALETHLNTRDLKYGDGFAARVVKPVYYEGKLVVPEGSIVEGKVLLVRDKRPAEGASELMLRPDLLSTPGGEHFTISATVIANDPLNPAQSDSEGNLREPRGLMSTDIRHAELASGAGFAGGALVAGVEGAAIGTGVGAAVVAGIWLATVRHIELNPGSRFTVKLDRAMQLQPVAAAGATGAQ